MDFKNVDKKYRPVPFWSWNENLSPEETRRQVEIMDESSPDYCFSYFDTAEHLADHLFSYLKISPEIDEAAVIDGASPIGLFFRIVMPLMKPVLVTVMVLTFLNTWNEFVMPLYFLGSTDKWPMTLAVYNFFGMYFKDWKMSNGKRMDVHIKKQKYLVFFTLSLKIIFILYVQ